MFGRLAQSQPMPLDEVYDPDVTFEDPFREIEGRQALARYFEKLNGNVASCTFTFGEAIVREPFDTIFSFRGVSTKLRQDHSMVATTWSVAARTIGVQAPRFTPPNWLPSFFM
jgi:hypothetical protein